jgi:hypothetical protein
MCRPCSRWAVAAGAFADSWLQTLCAAALLLLLLSSLDRHPRAAARPGPEFPPFQTIMKGEVYDLRLYDPYPVVEMDYKRREGGYLTLGALRCSCRPGM